MPTLEAKIVDKKPICPACELKYQPGTSFTEYGTHKDGFWFTFICDSCSSAKNKVKVKYLVDHDFNLINS